MFQSLEIKLSTAVVVPLLDLIRETAARDPEAPPKMESREDDPWTKADALRMHATPGELEALLTLFRGDFPRTGVIRVSANETTDVTRACALLRLRLRRSHFAHVNDADFQSTEAPDPERANEELKPVVMSYLFLATLQEVLIQHQTPDRSSRSAWHRVARAMRNVFVPQSPTWTREADGPLDADKVPNAERWRVIVLNDPVNLMSYVTAAFQIVLGLPRDLATQHMREVHEKQRSIVWMGSQNRAEEKMRALRAWHLATVIEQVPAEKRQSLSVETKPAHGGRHSANVTP